MMKAGLHGFVPFFSGDILLMTGTFQEFLVHKTLRFKTEEENVPVKYPGSNKRLKLHPAAVPHTVIRSVQGSVGTLFRCVQGSVGSPASGSAKVEVLPPPVPDAAVDTATEPKDIAQVQILAKISEAREFLECLELVFTKYDKMLERADTEECTALESTLTKLSEKFVEGQRAKVLAEISQEAAQRKNE